MSADVPAVRGIVPTDGIRSGRVVSARTWESVASLTNWIYGRGLNVVPLFNPNVTLATSKSYTCAVRFEPGYATKERIWGFGFRVSSAGTNASIKMTMPSSTTATIAAYDYAAHLSPGETFYSVDSSNFVRETGITQTASEVSQSVVIEVSGNSVVWEKCNAWDLPRPVIAADASELGSDLTRFRSGETIRATDFNQIHGAYVNMIQGGYRHCIQWFVPWNDGSANITSFAKSHSTTSDWTSVFDGGVPILGRKHYRNSSGINVKLMVYGWNDSGADGYARMNGTEAGESSNININTTSPAWHGPVTLAIDEEDLTDADGVGTVDYMDVEISNSTANTTYVTSVAIWEEV